MKSSVMSKINYYLFIFFTFSIGGWISEMIFGLITMNRIVNPGSLSGPWCPIYGVAGVFICLFLYKDKSFIKNLINVFIISTLDEYLSAFISEEIFNHKIWDYSNNFLNFQGRVCLSMTLLFTFIGMMTLYLIKPIVDKIYDKYMRELNIINIILLVLFIFNIVFQSIIHYN